MAPRLDRDQPKHLVGNAVALLIIDTRAAELLHGHRRDLIPSLDVDLLRQMMVQRALAVVEHEAERSGQHLLEADRQHAVRRAAFDRLPREPERGRSEEHTSELQSLMRTSY